MVDILEHATSWVSASMLATMLGTSERSIRNYVTELNSRGNVSVASSKEGYRLARADNRPSAPVLGDNAAVLDRTCTPTGGTSIDARCNYVASHLVNAHEPLSVFDLSAELCISESTLASAVMPEVRELVGRFNLSVETHDFKVSLTGIERDKRKLLGHIATHNSYGYFSSTHTLEDMFPDFNVQQILANLVEICQRSELFINDYALSNLLVHLMVIIIRLTANNELSEIDGPIDGDGLVAQLSQRDQIVRCAKRIASYFEQEFGCAIPRADFQQILLLLALSIERVEYRELDFEKLASIIDPTFVNTVLEILNETGNRYNIPHFIDEPMRLQLVLHMHNAYQRAVYHVSYPNPLASQIKSEYAPVYDMAVYLTHRFSTIMGVEISENEIAFIAFHIGAYFERAAAPNGLLTCTVIVEDYHDFARKLVDDLEFALKDEAQIVSVMSCDRYLSEPPKCDAVITTIDVTVPAECEKILIGPILTKQNLRKVRDHLARIQEGRRHNYARTLLRRLIKPELFCRNVSATDAASCIDALGTAAIAAGYADADYVADVHLRESVSSTAFTDCLAVPHAISVYPRRSFIAVAHCDAPIPWGRHDVRFVLMIGITQDEMGLFRDVLDLIIEVFSNVENTMRLLQTDSYDEFLDTFCRGMA